MRSRGSVPRPYLRQCLFVVAGAIGRGRLVRRPARRAAGGSGPDSDGLFLQAVVGGGQGELMMRRGKGVNIGAIEAEAAVQGGRLTD